MPTPWAGCEHSSKTLIAGSAGTALAPGLPSAVDVRASETMRRRWDCRIPYRDRAEAEGPVEGDLQSRRLQGASDGQHGIRKGDSFQEAVDELNDPSRGAVAAEATQIDGQRQRGPHLQA